MVRSLKLEVLHLRIFNQNLLNTDYGPEIVLSIADTLAVAQRSPRLHGADTTLQEIQFLVP